MKASATIWFRSFRAGLLATALIACAADNDDVRAVGADAYTSPACWFDSSGEFSAFLVIARDGDAGVAYPISGKCLVSNAQRSLGAVNPGMARLPEI